MKRAGNLIGEIADMQNLEQAYWLAQRGKANRREVCEFREDFLKNINKLREQLLSGNVKLGNYRLFKIFDPKERVICAAPFSERVLHHALIHVCEPYFERHFIDDTYACRKGRGTCKALEKAQANTRKYKYFVKLDVRKYFDSIDHAILKQKLERLFKDRTLLHIFSALIDSYPVEGEPLLSQLSSGKGLPIGNLTSQFFANYYLSFADHYAKEKLKVPAYARYMDDVIMWGNDKTELLAMARAFVAYCAEELALTLKPLYSQSCESGVPFLGYLIYSNEIRLQQRRKRRFIGKWNRYQANYLREYWTQEEFARHIRPLCAYIMRANTFGLRQTLLAKRDANHQALTA